MEVRIIPLGVWVRDGAWGFIPKRGVPNYQNLGGNGQIIAAVSSRGLPRFVLAGDTSFGLTREMGKTIVGRERDKGGATGLFPTRHPPGSVEARGCRDRKMVDVELYRKRRARDVIYGVN